MYACAALPTIPPETVGGGRILVIWRVRVPKSFWEGLGKRFGGSRGGFGARGRLGSLLGALGAPLGPPWAVLGPSWAGRGPNLEPFRPVGVAKIIDFP